MARGGRREGAGRPALPPEERRNNVTIKLTAGELAALDARAEELGLSRGATVAALVSKRSRRTK